MTSQSFFATFLNGHPEKEGLPGLQISSTNFSGEESPASGEEHTFIGQFLRATWGECFAKGQ